MYKKKGEGETPTTATEATVEGVTPTTDAKTPGGSTKFKAAAQAAGMVWKAKKKEDTTETKVSPSK